MFANIVIGDEINRASPKTQSALLEVMEERQVTVDGVSRGVPRPFVVIATQNPIEMEGTYNLPEAQLDRFLLKMSMGYPDLAAEAEIVLSRHGGPPPVLDPVLDRRRGHAAWSPVSASVRLDPQLVQYAVGLVQATRSSSDLRLGASPRGSLGLLRAAQSLAAAEGRGYAIADDVKRLAVPVLAHRLLVAPDAQLRGVSAERVVTDLLAQRQRAGRRRAPDGQAQREPAGASSGSRAPGSASSPGRSSSSRSASCSGSAPSSASAPPGSPPRSWRVVLVHEPLAIDVAPQRPATRGRAPFGRRSSPSTFRARGRRARAFTAIETVAGERHTAALPAIAAGHVEPLTYELDTSRRGNVTAGPLVLRRTDRSASSPPSAGSTGTVHGRRPPQAARPAHAARPAGSATSRARPARCRRARRRSTSSASTSPATTCATSTGAPPPAPGRSWSSSSSTPPGPRSW